MPHKTAIVLGASGSVGEALLAEIVASRRFSPVIVVARRPLDPKVPGIVERLVPQMDPLHLTQAVVDALEDCAGDAVGFSVMGIGANTARLTIDEHRAVDVELNAAFARGLKRSGKVRHLAFMSAVGANITAKTTGSGAAGMPRYARVKGESEAAVTKAGPEIVSIFRPAAIIGSRHTPGYLPPLLALVTPFMPAKYRSIRTTQIAQAMVAAAVKTPATSAIHEYPGMMALIADR
jgi:uncharacterized protein YbjT (DUF2867 family)